MINWRAKGARTPNIFFKNYHNEYHLNESKLSTLQLMRIAQRCLLLVMTASFLQFNEECDDNEFELELKHPSNLLWSLSVH